MLDLAEAHAPLRCKLFGVGLHGVEGLTRCAARAPGTGAFNVRIISLQPGLPGPLHASATGDRIVSALGTDFAAGRSGGPCRSGALMWATVRLEPTRVGILMMSAVLVGAASAALIAGERVTRSTSRAACWSFSPGCEVWPLRRNVPPACE